MLLLTLKQTLADEDAIIMTDSTKLIQIISNLISNAIKFTKHGQINFGYTLKNGFLEFFVKDTGIGISQEHQSKIFDRFYSDRQQRIEAIRRDWSGAVNLQSLCGTVRRQNLAYFRRGVKGLNSFLQYHISKFRCCLVACGEPFR